MAELELRDVTVTHGTITATHGVSVVVPSGSMLAVVGPNGAGKSSIVEAVAGRARYRGEILVGGKSLARMSAVTRTRSGIGVVPQDRELFYELSVHENLVVGCAGMGRSGRRDAIESSYESFPVLRRLADRRAGYLSGGERQILAIARAMSRRPQVVILDEPSLGLSPSMREEIVGNLVNSCRASQVTALITEQFVEMVLGRVDALVVLVNGSIEWSGVGSEEDWPSIRASYLGSTKDAASGIGTDDSSMSDA